MKNTIIILIVVVLLGLGAYFWKGSSFDTLEMVEDQNVAMPDTGGKRLNRQTSTPQTEPPSAVEPIADETKTVIGKSVEGRDIVAYHYGKGEREILFIGGIHGGYEWNTALVAYEAMDYFEKNESALPAGIKATVIPALNPDGIYKVTGKEGRFSASDVPAGEAATVPGRFNANSVDLNRNFDCDWQESGVWKTAKVSGGGAAFSEPESLAIKNYAETRSLSAAVVWYSSAGGVFASNCHDGVLPETAEIVKAYAAASGYPAYKSFDFYKITGDMVNWFAKKKIPAVSVLLTNHTDTEWSKNQAGIDALLKHYAE